MEEASQEDDEGREEGREGATPATTRKKVEKWDPRGQYELKCAELLINGLRPSLEESPVLEVACTSLLRKREERKKGGGKEGEEEEEEQDAACALGLYGTARDGSGGMLVVSWSLAFKKKEGGEAAGLAGAAAAAAAVPAEKKEKMTMTEKASDGGSASHTHTLSPRWWVSHPVDEYLFTLDDEEEEDEEKEKEGEEARDTTVAAMEEEEEEEQFGVPAATAAAAAASMMVPSTPTHAGQPGPSSKTMRRAATPKKRGSLSEADPEHGLLLLLRLLYGLNRHLASLLGPLSSPSSSSSSSSSSSAAAVAAAEVRGLVASGGLREEGWVIKPLSERMAQELYDPLALAAHQLPGWCDQILRLCPFLLPFRVRKEYFHLSSFGLGRAVHYLLQQQRGGGKGGGGGSAGGSGGGGGGGEGGNGTGRHGSHYSQQQQQRRAPATAVQQLKVRVSRHKLLASAEKVLTEYGHKRVILETEFQNEPGTGSGPTAEFFSLVSKELRDPKLGLWREGSQSQQEGGLYPQPWGGEEEEEEEEGKEGGRKGKGAGKGGGGGKEKEKESEKEVALRRFMCLGRLVGQALLDERLLDFRFAAPLVAALAGRRACQSLPAALQELGTVDPGLARQLQALTGSCGVVPWWVEGGREGGEEEEEGDCEAKDEVADLCLTFCLPGHPSIGLLSPSKSTAAAEEDEDVTSTNLALYIQRVLQVGLHQAVSPQISSLLTGLSDMLSPESLWVFTGEEVMAMIAGVGSEMGDDPDEILEALACDHGYTRGSQAVRWLVEILAGMEGEEQRQFLMFVTGSPGLPVGGLLGCSPRLTVVKKVAEGHVRAEGQGGVDRMLPSASTCTNYLKLPDYSSKSVMKERLFISLSYGQHSFYLS